MRPTDQMDGYRIVRGAGMQFLTNDPPLRCAVERADELEREVRRLKEENRELRYQEVARYRPLRRDVSHIKKAVLK